MKKVRTIYWFFAVLIVRVLSAPATFAAVFPRPDANGYTSKYDQPFIAAQDSCLAGRTCHTLPTPTGDASCDGPSGEGNASDEYIIRDNAGWEQINSGTHSKFFVCPGDYRSRGIVSLKRSGVPSSPRWVVWWSDVGYEPYLHPYHMAVERRAMLRGLSFSGADHVYVDRLSIFQTTTLAIDFQGWSDADHNIVNRMHVTADQGARSGSLIGVGYDSDHNTIQNSLIHDCVMADLDPDPIMINPTDGTIVANNEIFNCAHLIQLQPASDDFKDVVLENNDLYVTRSRYANCATEQLDPKGRCMCGGGSGLTAKGGAADPAHPIRFLHNRIWGVRKSVPCGNPSPQADSPAIELLGDAENIVIEKNIIHDVQLGISASGLWIEGEDAHSITIRHNIIADVKQHHAGKGSAALMNVRAERVVAHNNTIARVTTISQTTEWAGWYFGNQDTELTCNAIIDGGAKGQQTSRVVASNNVYLGNSVSLGESSATQLSLQDAKLAPHYYVRRLITGPERIALVDVAPTQPLAFPMSCGN